MSAVIRVIRGTNEIDFLRWWRRGLIVSAVLMVISLGALGLRGLNLTVEFTGGVSLEVPVTDVSVEQARGALDAAGQGSAKVQVVSTPDGDLLRVQTTASEEDVQDDLRQVLADQAGTGVESVALTAVSPSWGDNITGQAVRALVFFLAAILVYLAVRLDVEMAIAAVVAVLHDIVISIGIYALFQFEVSPGTVIAFLTILGYSIYDTVVVFDQVKENEARPAVANRLDYDALVSLSMNQVLLRSLNTSITSLIPVISLLVVGAGVLGAVTLGQFAIALTVGLISGTYSSIMIASPTMVWGKYRRGTVRNHGGRRSATVATGPVTSGAVADAGPATRERGEVFEQPAGNVARPQGAIPPRPRKKGKRR
jgi:preprotein translocase subunit SecF